MHRDPHRLRAAVAALAFLLAAPGAAQASPRSPSQPVTAGTVCKPLSPVEVELRLLDNVPGSPAHFETRVTAVRPVEDLSMDVRLSGGARWVMGQRELAGALDAGARRALPMGVTLPRQGHSEVYVLVKFRLPGGGQLSRGAYLAFDDGLPARAPKGRESSWNGTPVLEYPAQGTGR